jgi:hypothetical protein
MTRVPDHEWVRVAAIETGARDGPPSPVLSLARLALIPLALLWLSGVVLGTCAAGSGEADTLRAREDSAHVRVHRAQQATAAALDAAERKTLAAERAVSAFRAARPAVPTVRVDTAPPVLVAALPPVVGGWGTVAVDDTTTLPTPRLVIGALVARDSALTLADAAISEQRLALLKWRVVGQAFVTERTARDSALKATTARWTAEVAAVRRSRWRWAMAGAAGAVVGTVFLLR